MDSGVKLNAEQLRATQHKSGPLLIIAGAGTGKTTVITSRINYLIEKGLAKTNEILALTFTEKAAREMEERVDEALPLGYTQMWISTFHSFCEQVLRAEALNIGLDPSFRLFSTSLATQFLRTNIFELNLKYFAPLGNPTKFVRGLLDHFSRLADEDLTPRQYTDWVKKLNAKKVNAKSETKIELEKWEELANGYKKYSELKTREGFMDFADLITNTLRLFRERKNILQKYQDKFKYILVDEYQDTNIAQNELAKLLAGSKKNITAVLDDDQSIYRFRGASFSNALQFRKTFPKSKILSLVKNYRSAQEILDSAYRLIQFNNPDRLEFVEKINKKLIAQTEEKGVLHFIHADRLENEAEEVAVKIGKLLAEGYRSKEFAILVRANNHADAFVRALLRHGIPYQFLGPGKLFKQEEVVDLIAYLKILANPDDSEAFYRLLLSDFFDFPGLDLARISNLRKTKNISLFELLQKEKGLPVSTKTKKKIAKFIKNFEKHIELSKKETAGQLLFYFLQDNKLMDILLDPADAGADIKAKNISILFDKLKTYESEHEDASCIAVVEWLELARELGESPLATDTDWTEVDAVNILTVHSAKGLEFPVVFLVNLVGQRFPSMNRSEQIPIPDALVKEVLPLGDFHLQEERRLFYVGMTRAQKQLFLTAANYYGEGKRAKKLSPFIFEALGDDIKSSEAEAASNQLTFLDYNTKTSQKYGELPPLHIDYLSYSQIETFRICPLHYKLSYVLKIPTPQTSAQSFGNSFHRTLKAFSDQVAEGKRPTEKLIFTILSDCWINEGYKGKGHEKKSYEKAKRFLKTYLKDMFAKDNLPIATEQPFHFHLADKKGNKLRVGGKIDRIDKNGKVIEIIDYKTGSRAISQKEADTSLQFSIYALAATKIKEFPYDRNPQDVKLSFYYFDAPEVVTTFRTHEQLKLAEEEIFSYKQQIEKSDFSCSQGIICQQGCEYGMFCNQD